MWFYRKTFDIWQCSPDRDIQQHPHRWISPPHLPPRAHHCRSPLPRQHHLVGKSSTTAISCCLPELQISKLKILHLHRVHLYSECARLDAVISLDGFLLPLVVGDVPGELEHCAADTGGCAPGRGGRARRVFLPFPPACYIWTRHDPRCPESATVPWNRFSGWARSCLRICGIKFHQDVAVSRPFHMNDIFPFPTLLYLRIYQKLHNALIIAFETSSCPADEYSSYHWLTNWHCPFWEMKY